MVWKLDHELGVEQRGNIGKRLVELLEPDISRGKVGGKEKLFQTRGM